MVDENILPKQDVIVIDNKISKIVKSGSVGLPSSTTIDGTDKYLMPGLFDMHAHLYKHFLPLLLMYGVTSVRDMGNDDSIFKLQSEIQANKILGPRLFVSGNILEGNPPLWDWTEIIQSTEQAKKAVHELKKKGVDQVKVYHTLSPDIHKAIITEAHECGLKVTGHIPNDLTPIQALQAGQDGIEHLLSIRMFVGEIKFKDSSTPGLEGWSEFTKLEIIEKHLQQLIESFNKYSTFFCPTLIVHQQMAALADYDSLAQTVDTDYYSEDDVTKYWNPTHNNALENIKGQTPLWFRNTGVIYEGMRKVLPILAKNSTLLAGTDTPNPFVIPGVSLVQELELMVESGLSNFQALQAATTNAACWLNVQSELGSVEEGKIANLLIVNKNPLNDINTIANLEQVILSGTAHTRNHLAALAKKSKHGEK